jgi:hypothetical protein
VRASRPRLKRAHLIIGSAILAVGVTLLALFSLGALTPRTRQALVAERGAEVMPFDLDQTVHVFEQFNDGGLQTVTAKDAAAGDQIALIQAHLQEEADKFSRGDFTDPAAIHGQAMPGLAELRVGATRIEVRYMPLPNGAQIRYTTHDPALVAALHHWFTAQVSDHGQHATDHQ